MSKILLGTYTRNNSEGIYEINLDEEKGQLENLKLVAKAQNPTYLDYDKETNRLYSVYQEGDLGGVASWDYAAGETKLLDSVTQAGTPPCYVHFNKSQRILFDANYHRGRVNLYKNGEIIDTWDYGEHAKAHFVSENPKDGSLFVCDLGNDFVYQYKNLKQVNKIRLDQGAGPRHIAFHPSLSLLYVFSELNNTVTVIHDDGEKLSRIQVLSSLPKANIESSGAAIRITKDGQHLYVSNRGHDSITLYTIDEKGLLKYTQNISTHGEHPRDFALSPSEKFVVCANRDSNNLTVYSRNPKNGRLKMVQKDVAAPEVVNVLFMEE